MNILLYSFYKSRPHVCTQACAHVHTHAHKYLYLNLNKWSPSTWCSQKIWGMCVAHTKHAQGCHCRCHYLLESVRLKIILYERTSKLVWKKLVWYKTKLMLKWVYPQSNPLFPFFSFSQLHFFHLELVPKILLIEGREIIKIGERLDYNIGRMFRWEVSCRSPFIDWSKQCQDQMILRCQTLFDIKFHFI
jgi:hypothetical protein